MMAHPGTSLPGACASSPCPRSSRALAFTRITRIGARPQPPLPARGGAASGRRAPRPRLFAPPPRGILDAFRASQPSTSSNLGGSAEAEEAGGSDGDLLGACPIECVIELVGAEGDGVAAFDEALAAAHPTALVVVDFYKTACGACRYVAPGFVKLCKKAGKDGGDQPDVVFLKHNVLDEDGGRSELAVREGVRAVPTFVFYRGGAKLEAFPTRDRAVIAAAVNRLVGREVL